VSAPRLAVLDYEMSNLRSAVKALERLGAAVRVARRPEEAGEADAVVLPGVGHFGEAMRRIRGAGLDTVVADAVASRRPVLGICLGMQLLFGESEESPGVPGLGVLAGRVERMRTSAKLPNIGWREVGFRPGAPLAPPNGAPPGHSGPAYYFVHSFVCVPDDPGLVQGTARHGGAEYCAVVGDGLVTGAQCHPEKSSTAGLALLRRWLASVPAPAGATAGGRSP
jgi:imidazole glycerol-phosphate synthase subunit HisH